jgi:tRNA A37 threonylcarbamoyladenosine biosynthesis protein TsaE
MSIFNFFKNHRETGETIELTDGQISILSDLESFLTDKTTQVFILRGYAGTGKTFITDGVIRFIKFFLKRKVCSMAPTGRAAKVFRSKTGEEHTSTIHRSIYKIDTLKTDTSLGQGKFKYYYEVAPCIWGNKSVYIVDEASMLSDIENDHEFFRFGSGFLMRDLIRYINFSSHPDSKIIFIGDSAQLPPVGMKFSPALLAGYLKKEFNLTVKEGEITEVVRQKIGSGIIKTAALLRDGLEDNLYSNFQLIRANDIFDISPSAVVTKYLEILNSGKSSIILVHSNKQALSYNLAIRKVLQPHSQEEVAINDVLIVTQNNYNSTPQLMNGEFIKVLDILDTFDNYSIRFNISKEDIDYLPNKANIKIINPSSRTIEVIFKFRFVRIEIQDINDNAVEMKVYLLESTLFDENTGLSSIEQRALYIDFQKRFKSKYPKLEDQHNKDKFKEEIRQDLQFNALRSKFGYAITCHKAQGGEWDSPLVDFNTYMGKYSAGYFRWSYTAITRAKNSLYAINLNQQTPLSIILVNKKIKRLSSIPTNAVWKPSAEEVDIKVDNFDFKISDNFIQECQKVAFIKLSGLFSNSDIQIQIIKVEEYKVRYKFELIPNTLLLDSHFKKGKPSLKPPTIINSSSQSFQDKVLGILHGTLKDNSSNLIQQFKYYPPESYQEFLFSTINAKCYDLKITITNIENLSYRDRYYFKTKNNVFVMIDFIYNGKGLYTSLEAHATNDDDDLNNLLDNF